MPLTYKIPIKGIRFKMEMYQYILPAINSNTSNREFVDIYFHPPQFKLCVPILINILRGMFGYNRFKQTKLM